MANINLQIWGVVAVVAAAVILFAVAAHASRRRKLTEELQILFGPEYNRAVRLYGDRKRAEVALESRRRRLNEMGVHELPEAERDRFFREWTTIQSSASNDPARMIVRADFLLNEVMRVEGCPADDPDERKLDMALLHPTVAEQYRNASEILARHEAGLATSTEYRKAVAAYSDIFAVIFGKADTRDNLKKVS